MYHETTVTYTEDAINYIKDKRRHALALFFMRKIILLFLYYMDC